MFTTSSPEFCIEPLPYYPQILSRLVVAGYLKIGWIPLPRALNVPDFVDFSEKNLMFEKMMFYLMFYSWSFSSP